MEGHKTVEPNQFEPRITRMPRIEIELKNPLPSMNSAKSVVRSPRLGACNPWQTIFPKPAEPPQIPVRSSSFGPATVGGMECYGEELP